jgi:hypothetical protein
LGLQLVVVEASAAKEFESAFARLSTLGVKGVLLLADPSIIERETRTAEAAQKTRLPTAFQRCENVEAGDLLSCGPHSFRYPRARARWPPDSFFISRRTSNL